MNYIIKKDGVENQEKIKFLVRSCLENRKYRKYAFRIAEKYQIIPYFNQQCKRYSLDPIDVKNNKLGVPSTIGSALKTNKEVELNMLLNMYFPEYKKINNNILIDFICQ